MSQKARDVADETEKEFKRQNKGNILTRIQDGFSRALLSNRTDIGLLPQNVEVFGRAPASVEGGGQGDHLLAYALYEAYVSNLIDRYLSLGASNNYDSGISGFIHELEKGPKLEKKLLEHFGLLGEEGYKSEEFIPFSEIIAKINDLQEACDKEIKDLDGQAELMRKLSGRASENRSKEDAADISLLNPKLLEKQAADIRHRYFFDIVQEFAQEYLIKKNKSRYTALPKIPGKTKAETKHDRKEGGFIRGALGKLEPYKTRDLKDSDIKSIVENIGILLYFPPLTETNIKKLKEQYDYDESKNYPNVRTNNAKIFEYIVTRHLLAIFATFEKLGENKATREKIVDAFIDEMIKKPSFDNTVNWKKVFEKQGLKPEDIKQHIVDAVNNVEKELVAEQANEQKIAGLPPPYSLKKGTKPVRALKGSSSAQSSSAVLKIAPPHVAPLGMSYVTKRQGNSRSKARQSAATPGNEMALDKPNSTIFSSITSQNTTNTEASLSLIERANEITHEYKPPSGDILRGRETGAHWYSQAMTRAFGPVGSKSVAAQNVHSMEDEANEKKHGRDEISSDSVGDDPDKKKKKI